MFGRGLITAGLLTLAVTCTAAAAGGGIEPLVGKKVTLHGTWHVGDTIGPAVIVDGSHEKVYVELPGCTAKDGRVVATARLKDPKEPRSVKCSVVGIENMDFRETQLRLQLLNKYWVIPKGTRVTASGVLYYWKTVDLIPKGVKAYVVPNHYFFCAKGLTIKRG